MTKQSSEKKSAPMARLYLLDCRATLAMTKELEVQKTQITTRTKHTCRWHIQNSSFNKMHC